MSEKTLPQNEHAERATLGAIFLDREAIVPIAAWLAPEHFYFEKHAWIYEAQLACYNRRTPPDLTTVADELRRSERLDQIGGMPFLIDLANSVPTAFHIEYYASIVERTAVLRRLIRAGGKIAALGFQETDDVETTLDQAEQELFAVSHQRNTKTYATLSEIGDAYYEFLERRQAQDQAVPLGLPTGFLDLDRMTGGLQKSDLLILAARPGVGKSSLAMTMAFHVARQQHAPVGVFALEMGRDQLYQRLLAIDTGIDSQKLRTGRLSTDELVQITDSMGRLNTLPIIIDDAPRSTVTEIRAKARRMHAEHGLELLIIDYLQLMSSGKRSENRVQEVSEISRALKQLARELNIPVIALSQLSRAVEGRTSHVPVLADLRESGSLEQDADLVLFIYREELYDKESDKKGVAEIHIAKHRNGPLGVVPLFFDQRTTRFRDLAPYDSPAGY